MGEGLKDNELGGVLSMIYSSKTSCDREKHEILTDEESATLTNLLVKLWENGYYLDVLITERKFPLQ